MVMKADAEFVQPRRVIMEYDTFLNLLFHFPGATKSEGDRSQNKRRLSGRNRKIFGAVANLFGRNRESRASEAAGRGNSPEAKPRKLSGRKREVY
jgi:hypothetical protein